MGETLSGEMGSPKMNYVLRPTRVMSQGEEKSSASRVARVGGDRAPGEEEDVMYAAAV